MANYGKVILRKVGNNDFVSGDLTKAITKPIKTLSQGRMLAQSWCVGNANRQAEIRRRDDDRLVMMYWVGQDKLLNYISY